ncbi:hypothetical protein BDV33DRAFT_53227 [Aspergillus novoparasiticus]|uniref:Uncharacterized protein n=1 Tax=Aspergillus novoparasiticus TaxID=986946 RepID=A0A5N6F8S9_9EURO|nr:hypothetical protein BDV33DRAFT_53227 [Aspergillus novoparasiticus]
MYYYIQFSFYFAILNIILSVFLTIYNFSSFVEAALSTTLISHVYDFSIIGTGNAIDSARTAFPSTLFILLSTPN